MKALCNQLAQEHAALDKIVMDLSDSKWDMTTPFDDWTIREEICHIAYFDDKARLAATDPDGFQTDMLEILEGLTSVDDFLTKTIKDLMKLSPKALMDFWIDERTKMIKAIEVLEPQDKIGWYGPPHDGRILCNCKNDGNLGPWTGYCRCTENQKNTN